MVAIEIYLILKEITSFSSLNKKVHLVIKVNQAKSYYYILYLILGIKIFLSLIINLCHIFIKKN